MNVDIKWSKYDTIQPLQWSESHSKVDYQAKLITVVLKGPKKLKISAGTNHSLYITAVSQLLYKSMEEVAGNHFLPCVILQIYPVSTAFLKYAYQKTQILPQPFHIIPHNELPWNMFYNMAFYTNLEQAFHALVVQ